MRVLSGALGRQRVGIDRGGHRPLRAWGQMWLSWWWLCSAPAPSRSPRRVLLALTTGTLLLVEHTGWIPASAGCLLAALDSSPCSFRVSRRRCCDLPPDTFGKGAGPHPRARISAFSTQPLPLESLCWCPTPMQSLGVAGAWINHALERRQVCLHKSRSGLQMLPPRAIPGGVACKGGCGVGCLFTNTPKVSDQGDGVRAAGRCWKQQLCRGGAALGRGSGKGIMETGICWALPVAGRDAGMLDLGGSTKGCSGSCFEPDLCP